MEFGNSELLNPWHNITSLKVKFNSDTSLSLVSILLTSGNITHLSIDGSCIGTSRWASNEEVQAVDAAAGEFWSALKTHSAKLEVLNLELDRVEVKLDSYGFVQCLPSLTSCNHLSISATILQSFTPLVSLPKLETLVVVFLRTDRNFSHAPPYRGLRVRDLSNLIEGIQASFRKLLLHVAWDRIEPIQSEADLKQDVRNLREVCEMNDVQMDFVDKSGNVMYPRLYS